MVNGRGRNFHENGPRGGADTWSDGPAGALLSLEFFGPPPAQTVSANGVVVTVTEGSPTVIQAGAGFTIVANGVAITVTEGSPTVRALARVLPAGVSITVTEGVPTIRGAARILPAGVPITVTEGSPAVLRGPRTIAANGAVITVTEGLPLVRTLTRILPAGVAITVAEGSPTLAQAGAGARVIQILDGKAICVVFGSPNVLEVGRLGVPFALAPVGRRFPSGGNPARPLYLQAFRKG